MTQAVRNPDVTHGTWQCDCGSGHFVSIAQYLSDPEDAPTYFMFKNYQVAAEWPLLSRLKRLAEVLKWTLTGRGGHHLHWGEVILQDAEQLREMAATLQTCAVKWETWKRKGTKDVGVGEGTGRGDRGLA